MIPTVMPTCASATVRPDWKMPEPPPYPPSSGSWRAIAVDAGDAWVLCWGGENGDEGPDMGAVWPFVEDEANWRDFESLGFEVV